MSVGRSRKLAELPKLLKPLASITGLVIVWFALAEAGLVGDMPGPVPVALAGAELLPNPNLHSSIIASFRHIYVPYALAVVTGIPMGLAIGWNQTFRDLVFPSMELLRPVPPIAWLPIVILVLPTTMGGIMFITFLGAFFPILLNTISGVRGIDEDYIRVVRCLGGSPRQVLREAVIPAALPSIHTGLILGMGLAWVNLVAAEMISDTGLGRFVWVSYTSSSYPNILFSVIVIGALGYASSEVVRWVGNLKLGWTSKNE